MTQENPTPQGEHSTKTIDPPLISLIPIPDLAIDHVKVDFHTTDIGNQQSTDVEADDGKLPSR